MNMRQANLQIVSANGVKQYVLAPGRANSFDELYVDFHCAETRNGKQYTVFLHSKTDLVVQRIAI